MLKAFGNGWNQRVAAEQIYRTLLSAVLGAKPYDFSRVAGHKCGDKCLTVESLGGALEKEKLQEKQRRKTWGSLSSEAAGLRG